MTAMFFASRKLVSCATGSATVGWRLCWTRAKIATFGECWNSFKSKS